MTFRNVMQVPQFKLDELAKMGREILNTYKETNLNDAATCNLDADTVVGTPVESDGEEEDSLYTNSTFVHDDKKEPTIQPRTSSIKSTVTSREPTAEGWTTTKVQEWLKSNGVKKSTRQVLASRKVDGKALKHLSITNLRTLGINSLTDRIQLLQARDQGSIY